MAVQCAASGCATYVRNGIADPALAEMAHVTGVPGVRFWADDVPKDAMAEIRRMTPNLPVIAKDAKRGEGRRPIVETLALSGGGSDGAFGAGVLAGWTARGNRPEFEIVTGVSAGAIIAPFAFLGPAHDEELRRIWTEYQASDVATAQIIPGLFGGSALADSKPLANLVAKYVDRTMVRDIAAQYKRGRLLLVLTTNLDAQRPVVWNMGEIALFDTDEALELFRSVILASAAIPGALPPVNIPVEVNGKMYEEMHVDGGTTRELFVTAVQAPFKAFDPLYAAPPIRHLYIIKNGKLTPETEVVPQTTLTIATRAISTLIKSQNWGELYRIYRMALDAGADFNLMAVPASFNKPLKGLYDPEYQKALYAEGLAAGRSAVWLKSPPGQAPISVLPLPPPATAAKPRAPGPPSMSRPSASAPPQSPAKQPTIGPSAGAPLVNRPVASTN
ncbi:MAG: patatin-like phospholipase family protein [Hyphomicrobium sp.]|nr:patatin-like phospholipase family protein [Hyphomicrobium sp.]